jgi:hypothetical protein
MHHLRLRTSTVLVAIAASAIVSSSACDDSPTEPDPPGTVRIVFLGPTARRTDLPGSAQGCINAVGMTHIHPSWQSFAAIPLQPFPPDRYEIRFEDVPVDMRVSFRINDQNSCDENPTGAVTRNVFVNTTRLTQNTTTPGSGDEPGYAFTVSSTGRVTQ